MPFLFIRLVGEILVKSREVVVRGVVADRVWLRSFDLPMSSPLSDENARPKTGKVCGSTQHEMQVLVDCSFASHRRFFNLNLDESSSAGGVTVCF